MTLKNNAETARYKGDQIRWFVSVYSLYDCIDLLWMTLKNEVETVRCKEDRIRGCVSISKFFVCIDLLWITLTNDAETGRCKGNRKRWCVSYLFVLIVYEWLERMRQRQIRGCISISVLFSLFTLNFNGFKNDLEEAICVGGRIRECVSKLLYRFALNDHKEFYRDSQM